MRLTIDIELGGANMPLAQIIRCMRDGLVVAVAARKLSAMFPDRAITAEERKERRNVYRSVEQSIKIEMVHER